MSDNVALKPTVGTPTAPPNPEPATAETAVPNADFSTYASGNENGGTYFELNWQIGQGQNLRQTLLTIYYGDENPTDPTVYNPAETSTDPTAYGYDGNFYPPNLPGSGSSHYGYGGNLSEFNPYDDDGGNLLPPNYYGVDSDNSLPLYSTDDADILSWNDFVNLISDNKDFSDFREQSPEFWREVRQISETNVPETESEPATFKTETKIETKSTSKYERLLTEMDSKKLSPDEFAETLPPPDREVFKARLQIDKTFGTDLFESDGVTLNETGQLRVREAAFENNRVAALPTNTVLPSNEEKTLPVGENAVPVSTRREIVSSAKNAVLFGENIPNRPTTKKFDASELKTPDKSASIAVGNNASSILADNTSAPRVAGNVMADSSTSSVSSIVRRDGGAALGGALINGSFASIDNFRNAENKGVGNSTSIGNAAFNGGKSFAAGATGAMMSAAVGSLIPNSDAVVSGVVGFISGVVVGVEADQGLRWLSGERPAIAPSSNNPSLPEDNSFAPNLQLAAA